MSEIIVFAIIAAAAVAVAGYCWMRLKVAQTNDQAKSQEMEMLNLSLNEAQENLRAVREQYHASKQEAALATQQAEQLRTQMTELRQDREKFMEHAKAAAFETGQQISNRLMEDHKREREHAQKHIEQFTKNSHESLMNRQKELAETIGKVEHKLQESSGNIDVLVRAMKNPIGAGAEAEIGFDNLLSALGLRAGMDYDLQFHMASEAGSLRPDALIYLPNNQVMVVDCKASQHIYALYESEGTERYDAVFNKLCATMRDHIKKLGEKQYAAQLQKHLQGKGKPADEIIQVMYVPNEEVITRVRKHDTAFIETAIKHNILLAGPDTLPSIFMIAKNVITQGRQAENQQRIMTLMQDLMGDVINALSYVDGVGKALQTSGGALEKFVNSLNARALPKMRNLTKMGLTPSNNKPIPQAITRFKLDKDQPIIDAESVADEDSEGTYPRAIATKNKQDVA